ncbi:MAG: hypothetical protein ACUZ8E_04125 [Candidatus Anammoxibacter sp.]
MKNQLVLIEWLDSKGGTSAWEHLDELTPLEPCKCKSVGFLLEDNKNYKTIAQSLSSNQVIGRLTVPSCSIKKTTKLG